MVNTASSKSLDQVVRLKRRTEKVLAELHSGDARLLPIKRRFQMLEGLCRGELAVLEGRTCSHSEAREKLLRTVRTRSCT